MSEYAAIIGFALGFSAGIVLGFLAGVLYVPLREKAGPQMPKYPPTDVQ